MKFTHLGRTGLLVSRLCLGTMNFGWTTAEQESHAIMDRALDVGINFFDTAEAYAEGETERIIGAWFAQGGGRRERTVLATKLFVNPGLTGTAPNDGRLSSWNIRRAVDASLKRLRTDHIDLYQMHHVDRAASWDEIWEAMDVLTQQGKVLYVGSSNFAAWDIVRANEQAAARRSLGLVSEQSIYNLVTREPELELLPAAEAYGVGVLVWSPLHGGLLAGIIRKGREGDRRQISDGRAQVALEKHRDAIQAFEEHCNRLGEEPANVALAWLLQRPAVTSAIVGPRTTDQFDATAPSVDLVLDDETLAELDAIFPGYKPAPNHYAW